MSSPHNALTSLVPALPTALAPKCIAAGLLLGALSPSVQAQVVTVTMTDDVVDFGGAQQVLDLPGPDGLVSFREACTAANNTSGPQTIEFAIPNAPPNEWSGGVAILYMDFNVFVLTDDGTTVDFSTQAAFTGDTNPGGNEVGIRTAPLTGAPAIWVGGDDCTIKGLDRVDFCGYGVELSGNNNRVVGCTISGPLYAGVYITGGFGGPPASNNVVGGTLPGEGNVLSSGNDGVRIDGPADDNVVVGNVLSGSFNGAAVRGSPFTPLPNGNRIGGPSAAERNLIAGAGKYGEEGFPTGAQVQIEQANGTVVEGNYIGTTADGTAPAPIQRGPVGVNVVDSSGTIVRGNVIGGIRVVGVNHAAGQIFGDGVRVTTINGPTADTTIEDNLIGTDPSGQTSVPNRHGVRIVPFIASHGLTGTVVSGNTVAFNEGTGLVVAQSVTAARISENTFFDNGLLGIDLLGTGSGSGVTANDPLDADSGANGLQNFPVLESATLVGPTIFVTGSLSSEPLTDYTVELFASPACDASGFGEGQVFLGSTYVVTDGSGTAVFEESLPVVVPNNWVVTSTATREPEGRTSELSSCVRITRGLGASFCDMSDGSLAACPCGNPGSPDTGCDVQQATGGVGLAAVAQVTAPLNRATMCAAGFPPASSPTGIVIRSPSLDAARPVVFGDGVRCVGMPVVRLGAATATGGSSMHTFGHGSTAGSGTFHYQLWFRNTPAMFCTPDGFNVSNGTVLTW